MIVSKAAKRYAKAFYAIAEEKGSVEAVKESYEAVAQLLANSAELVSALASPLASQDQRGELLKAIFSGKIDDLTLSQILFLNSKDRADILADLAKSFASIYEQQNNIQRAELISAQALSAKELDSIIERLEKKTGKKILAQTAVDASYIGGFRIALGDQVFDYTIKTQLENLQNNIVNS